jgi:hypothetical protein
MAGQLRRTWAVSRAWWLAGLGYFRCSGGTAAAGWRAWPWRRCCRRPAGGTDWSDCKGGRLSVTTSNWSDVAAGSRDDGFWTVCGGQQVDPGGQD